MLLKGLERGDEMAKSKTTMERVDKVFNELHTLLCAGQFTSRDLKTIEQFLAACLDVTRRVRTRARTIQTDPGMKIPTGD